jgi:lysophospholipase L1-like esterase
MSAAAEESITVLNKGVPGQTILEGLARFDRDVVQAKADHLVLFFGINDACNQNIPTESFRRGLATAVDKARKQGVRTIVLVIPNPVLNEYIAERHGTHPFVADLDAHLGTFREIVRTVATDKQCEVVDLNAAVNSRGGASTDGTSLLRNEANSGNRDGVHLTAEGYQVLAELVAPILKDRVKAGETVVCLGDSVTFGVHVEGAGTSTGDTYPGKLSQLLNSSSGKANTP